MSQTIRTFFISIPSQVARRRGQPNCRSSAPAPTTPRNLSFRRHTLRKKLVLAGALLAALPATAQPNPGMVYENASEFHTLADVNGDGGKDFVVLDKSSGHFRIAEGQNDGTLQWRNAPGNSGIVPVTGFSTGPVSRKDRSQLVVSGTLANRIHIIDTPADGRLTEPLRIPETRPGPSTVTALNIPSGPTGFDPDFFDLAYHPTLERPGESGLFRFFRNTGSGLPFASKDEGQTLAGQPSRPNRIEIEKGKMPVYGVLEDNGKASTFRLLDPDDALGSELGILEKLPENAAYVYADFDGDDRAEFLFHQPGKAELQATEWTGNGLGAPTVFTYPADVAELRVINSAGKPELLVIREGRDRADRVGYQGGDTFTIEENFKSGALPIRGGLSIDDKLHLLEGNGSATDHRTFSFSNGSHDLVDEQELTALPDDAANATILLFDSKPLADPDARLLGRFDAGPWTSAFALNTSSAEVQSERFRGTAQGLGDPTTETLNQLPSGTGGGLVNQFADDNSIFFRDAAVGERPLQLSVSPGTGTYDRAVRPEFEQTGDADILYRTTTRVEGWTDASSEPPLILDDTTLYAVARDNQGRFSNIVRAEYTITGNPGTRDSNGDRLPDFAAVANGLDPLSDSEDADGDGFTNFQEVLGGTDPLDDSSRPDRDSVSFEYPNSFDLLAAPAVPDPAGGGALLRPFAESDAPSAAKMVTHKPDGVFLGGAATQNHPDLNDPAALFEELDLVADDLFLVTATKPNFPVNDGTPKDYGRQVAALVVPPPMEFDSFDYQGFGENGGYDNLQDESSAWRNAALNYFNKQMERPDRTRDPIGPQSTLELLLVEHILGQKLLARNLTDRANITLTPFRTEESPLDPVQGTTEPSAGSTNRKVSIESLRILQRVPGGGGDAFSIQSIIQTVQSKLEAADTNNIQQLKALADLLYKTSATSGNPGSLRQPLAALRHFIRNGDFSNTGFDDEPAASNFPVSLLNDASSGVSEIENAITSRTIKSVTIYVEGGENAAARPTWKEVAFTTGDFDPDSPQFTGIEYALLDDQGSPFPIARAFPLTPGSVFRVRGYVLEQTPYGDAALEVIPRPELAFLNNATPADSDADLIPDSVQESNPDSNLAPFADSDGDGYSDLQELLDGSDPTNGNDVPMENGSPAPVRDVEPPEVAIESLDSNTARIKFDFPGEYAPFIEFALYESTDLKTFSPTGDRARHTGNDNHRLDVNRSDDKRFYRLRMRLK